LLIVAADDEQLQSKEAIIERLQAMHADRMAPTLTYTSGKLMVIGVSIADIQSSEPVLNTLRRLFNMKRKRNTHRRFFFAIC
jgi:hypothetical protein